MSSQALTRYDGPQSLAERREYSELMSNSTLLPSLFRLKPANVLYGVEYARMVDIPVLAAVTGIHVIDGKPTASAGLMTALVRRAGHKFRIRLTGTLEAGDLSATATVIRADDPEFPFASTWNIDRAIRANLLQRKSDGTVTAVKDRSAWATYLEAMLKARATSEVCREAAEEALYGIRYTPEELLKDGNVDEEGNPLEGTITEPLRSTNGHRPPAAPAEAPAEDIVDAEVVEDTPTPAPAPASAPQEQAAPAPAPAPQNAPQEADDATLDVAYAIARAALECSDADKLRDTYREARDRGIKLVDVFGALGDDDLAALAIETEDDGTTVLPLGALLMATGAYVVKHGTAVRDLDEVDTTPAPAPAEDLPEDPWATDEAPQN